MTKRQQKIMVYVEVSRMMGKMLGPSGPIPGFMGNQFISQRDKSAMMLIWSNLSWSLSKRADKLLRKEQDARS